jgi:hypothetical protein
VLLGDGTGKLRKPGPATKVLTALVGNGPDGTGFGLADVTGDGLSDILIQDPQGTETAPILHLYASADASFMPSKELSVMGFDFADVDGDGKTDIVSTVQHRLTAQLSRPGGTFEAHDRARQSMCKTLHVAGAQHVSRRARKNHDATGGGRERRLVTHVVHGEEPLCLRELLVDALALDE